MRIYNVPLGLGKSSYPLPTGVLRGVSFDNSNVTAGSVFLSDLNGNKARLEVVGTSVSSQFGVFPIEVKPSDIVSIEVTTTAQNRLFLVYDE